MYISCITQSGRSIHWARYGLWHSRYRLLSNGLVCVGQISALREASLAQEIHDAGVSSMTALYMGMH